MHANTFAARAGRWSAQHRKTAIWGWIAFVVVAFVIGGAVGVKKPDRLHRPRRLRPRRPARPRPLPEGRGRERPRPGAARAASARRRRSARPSTTRSPPSRRKPRVAEVESPLRHGQRGPDRQGRPLRPRELQGPRRRGPDRRRRSTPVVAAVAPRAGPEPRRLRRPVRRREREQGAVEVLRRRLQEGRDSSSLPITLIILVVAFGALVAAGIPLLLGFTAVMATLGLVALPSQIVPMDDIDQLDHPAHRPGGRRRLHAVLPAP